MTRRVRFQEAGRGPIGGRGSAAALLGPACVALVAGALAGAGLLAGALAGASEPASDDPRLGITWHHEASERATLYEPTRDYITRRDFSAFPAILRPDEGGRSLVLRAVRKSEKGVGLKSLEVVVDGVSSTFRLKRSDVEIDRSGCRVAEWILLKDQERLIRSIAAAGAVDFIVTGTRSKDTYRLESQDLDGFRKMVAVYDLPRSGTEEPGTEKPGAPARGAPEGPADVPPSASKVNTPELIPSTRVTPTFPIEAREKVAGGMVILQAVIRKDGTVGDVTVLRSSACDCGFEAAALAAVRQWRYKPGTADGEPVDVYFTIEVDFSS